MNPVVASKVQAPVRPDATWTPLLEISSKEVFQIMLQTELSNLPFVGEQRISGDTTAMVGLAGALRGVLSIRCNSRTAERIAGRMLGSEEDVHPSEVPDALAEICNMVAGNFKAKIAGLVDNCMLSVPTVIRGDDYELVTIADVELITVGLTYEESPIWFCLAIHR